MMTDVLAKKLLLYPHIKPCKRSFRNANGASSTPLGIIYNVEITIGTVTMPADVFVTQASNYWMLLGNSFLAPMGVQIDFTNRLLTYPTGPSHNGEHSLGLPEHWEREVCLESYERRTLGGP